MNLNDSKSQWELCLVLAGVLFPPQHSCTAKFNNNQAAWSAAHGTVCLQRTFLRICSPTHSGGK